MKLGTAHLRIPQKYWTVQRKLSQLPSPLRYAIAMVAITAAIGVQYQIHHVFGVSGAGFLYPVTFLVSWHLGFGPALVSAFVGTVGSDLFCYEPMLEWANRSVDVQVRLAIFFLTATFVAWIIDRGQRSEERFRAAERRSHSSETILRVIADRLPAFVSYMDSDGRYRFVNKTYADWFEKSVDEIIGKTRAELVNHPGTYETMSPHEKKAFSGSPSSYELTLSKPNGEMRSLDVEYLPDVDRETGKVNGIIGVAHDVTARKNAQREAENAKLELYGFLMQMPIGAGLVEGDDFRVTLVNDTYMDLLFGEKREIRGRPLREVFRELKADDPHFLLLEQVYKTGEAFIGNEMPIVANRAGEAEPRNFYLNIIYHPKRDPSGKVDGIIILFYDVTELVLSRQKLEAAVRARDEFLSIASHELKTPLSSLKLQTQLHAKTLRKGDPLALDAEKMKLFYERSERQIARLDRLIEDMLDVSRLQTGRMTIERETFDLSELVAEIIDRTRADFAAAKCPVETRFTPGLEVNADRFRIEQVILNLFSNAMKYGRGKPIHVTTALDQSGRAILEVRDEGVGIDEKHHLRIFQRFERVTSDQHISGLGLGLYIVRAILEQHRGTISVESEIGKGAMFRAELPTSTEPGG